MYRDNLEALRQRSRELDRALMKLPSRPRPVRRLPEWRFKVIGFSLLVGGLVLALGLSSVGDAARMRASHQAQLAQMRRALTTPEPATETWAAARVVSGRNAGAHCAVMVSPPCRANIICDGIVMYHGAGTCPEGRYLDPADSMLDDTPQCAIDFAGKKAVVREIACHRRFHGTHYEQSWQAELELQ
jgi:hypothetical protein